MNLLILNDVCPLTLGLGTGADNVNQFWSERGSGFGEPDGTPKPKILERTPVEQRVKFRLKCFLWAEMSFLAHFLANV